MAVESEKLLAALGSNTRLAMWASGNFAVHSKSQVLGQGSFGIVLAGNRVVDCKAVAVKIEELDVEALAHQLSCAQVLQAQPHPNVLELLETFVDMDQKIYATVFPQAFFDLRLMMRGRAGSMNVLGAKLVQALAADLTHAVAHLNGLHIIHRDVKPANCVIFIRPNCTALKLGDFGCARVAQPFMTPGMCTSWYRAPELFREAGGRGPKKSAYTEAVDVWSLGCVVGEMLMCDELFSAASEQEVANVIRVRLGMEEEAYGNLVASATAKVRKPGQSRIFDVKFPRSHAGLQAAGNDFLRKCFKYDASHRLSAAALLTHELVHEHGAVYRCTAVAADIPVVRLPPPGTSVANQPGNAAQAEKEAASVEPPIPHPAQEDAAEQGTLPEGSSAGDGHKCACSGFCKNGKNCHGSDGCKTPPADGSRFCDACRCKAVKRKAHAPPTDLEYSSGDEDAHVPNERCMKSRSRGDTCDRHRHAKMSLVLKACRRLGRHGLLDLLVPCDVEAFLQAPIHDDLVLQMIGAWIKHPVAVEALGRCRPRGRGYSADALMECLHGVPSPWFCISLVGTGRVTFHFILLVPLLMQSFFCCVWRLHFCLSQA